MDLVPDNFTSCKNAEQTVIQWQGRLNGVNVNCFDLIPISLRKKSSYLNWQRDIQLSVNTVEGCSNNLRAF